MDMGGVKKDDPAIICSGKDFLLWCARTGKDLLVSTYYCKEADGTIISLNSAQ